MQIRNSANNSKNIKDINQKKLSYSKSLLSINVLSLSFLFLISKLIKSSTRKIKSPIIETHSLVHCKNTPSSKTCFLSNYGFLEHMQLDIPLLDKALPSLPCDPNAEIYKPKPGEPFVLVSEDTFKLERFIQKIHENYKKVIVELGNGHKKNHWMWFFFPNVFGLGNSPINRVYSIKNKDELKAFISNKYLLYAVVKFAMLAINHKSLNPKATLLEIFGDIDNLKYISCMTMFYQGLTILGFKSEAAFFKYALCIFNSDFDVRTLKIMNGRNFLK
ncbi:MAG: DUF1810 domain-containing protein [Oscillospiraceae bacterium]|nr:DUF1810 domain-containing protein [Oscillospiraceae bacterium]